MVMTVDIPDGLVAEAAARGVDVETLLRERYPVRDPNAWPRKMSVQEAVDGILALQGRYKLDGISIRELLDGTDEENRF